MRFSTMGERFRGLLKSCERIDGLTVEEVEEELLLLIIIAFPLVRCDEFFRT